MQESKFIEPDAVYPEKLFEDHLFSVLESALENRSDSKVFRRFGLDIAVLVSIEEGARLSFIEVKSYGLQRQGGVGFGNRKGEGSQVDILISTERQLKKLDPYIGWAFVDATKSRGTCRYAFLKTSEAEKVTMGEPRRGITNNFRMSAIEPYMTSWPDFCNRLFDFLFGG